MLLEDLRNNIIKVMNDSKVPVDGAYYVMKDIMNELTAVYKEQLDAEAASKERWARTIKWRIGARK